MCPTIVSGGNEYLSIHPLSKSTRKTTTMKKKVAKPEKLQSAARRHALELSARVWSPLTMAMVLTIQQEQVGNLAPSPSLPNWRQPRMHDNQCHCCLSHDFCSFLGGEGPVDPKDNYWSPRSWLNKKRGTLCMSEYPPAMICIFFCGTQGIEVWMKDIPDLVWSNSIIDTYIVWD